MKPTREQCLKWVEEVADPKITPPLCDTFVTLTYSEFDSLCQRVWNEAIEAAARETDSCVGRDGRAFAREAIRELKVNP